MGITNAGLSYTLTAIFPTGPNIWYVGLIDNSGPPVLSAGDTLSSHSGWTEAAGGGVDYSGNRKLWTNGSPSSNQVTNASYVQFPITASFTVYGIFLCSVSTGTSGTLFGTAPLVGGPQAVVNTDTLNITITGSASSS